MAILFVLQLCATQDPETSNQTHTATPAPASASYSDVLAEISNFVSGLCIPTYAKKVSTFQAL